MIGDAHLYSNHVDMIAEQLTREPKARPRLKISERIPAFSETRIYEPQWLDLVTPSDFTLEGYEYHPALTAPMAV
jgi:thymidylate synthase